MKKPFASWYIGFAKNNNKSRRINKINRPTEVPEVGILCDLLWSDPDKHVAGWEENERGVSYIFGEEVVTLFLKKHSIELVCRAHQVVEDGYEFFSRR